MRVREFGSGGPMMTGSKGLLERASRRFFTWRARCHGAPTLTLHAHAMRAMCLAQTLTMKQERGFGLQKGYRNARLSAWRALLAQVLTLRWRMSRCKRYGDLGRCTGRFRKSSLEELPGFCGGEPCLACTSVLSSSAGLGLESESGPQLLVLNRSATVRCWIVSARSCSR